MAIARPIVRRLSPDTWAVLFALLLAALVRVNLIKNVTW